MRISQCFVGIKSCRNMRICGEMFIQHPYRVFFGCSSSEMSLKVATLRRGGQPYLFVTQRSWRQWSSWIFSQSSLLRGMFCRLNYTAFMLFLRDVHPTSISCILRMLLLRDLFGSGHTTTWWKTISSRHQEVDANDHLESSSFFIVWRNVS